MTRIKEKKQKDRKIERQKDRKTGRQKYRKAGKRQIQITIKINDKNK
jgi:hypothetical protein